MREASVVVQLVQEHDKRDPLTKSRRVSRPVLASLGRAFVGGTPDSPEGRRPGCPALEFMFAVRYFGPERPLLGLLLLWSVLSTSRITLEYKGKTQPTSDRENAFTGTSGGGSGIRTRDTLR